MTTHRILLGVAAECEKEPSSSESIRTHLLFQKAYEAINGPQPTIEPGNIDKFVAWKDKANVFYALCTAGGFMDAAMSLGRGIPWLSPIINYPAGAVILLNGSEKAVGGTNYCSRSGSMALALAASWLKVHSGQIPVDKADYPLDLEVNKLYQTASGRKFRIVKVESGFYRGQDNAGVRLDFRQDGTATMPHQEHLILEA